MIRIAILGAGIGREHLAALRTMDDVFEVRAIVDQDLARIEEIRNGDNFEAISDISKAFSDPDIDVIDVCLPPHLHVPVTIDALNAGKHVICEKPLATSLADADLIAKTATNTGKQVFPVFQYRWGPALAKLRHLMASGLTGNVNSVALETHWKRDSDYYSVPWRGTWAGEKGGAVLGHAIHNHDLLTHIAGQVSALSAMTATRINPIETEDCAAITFTMASGALCTSSITLGAAFDKSRLRFVFDHLTATSGKEPYAPGTAEWSFAAREQGQQAVIDDAVASAPDEDVGFAGFFAEIGRALNGSSNSAVTLHDGIKSVELVSAIYHAARTGERVSLPLPSDHPIRAGWQPDLEN